MVEKLDHLISSILPYYAGGDGELLLNGIAGLAQQQQQQQQQQQDGDLRTLCLNRLGLNEETVALLEAQEIDVECLKKMRFEDVDILFENRPLGPKVHFREALMLWRIELGLPMKSLRATAYRKRSSERDDCAVEDSKCSRGFIPSSSEQLGVVTPATTPDKLIKLSKASPNIDFKQYTWPMTPEVLRDLLAGCSVGRLILHAAELATLEKSFQSQLTAIVIDYHMAYDVKITALQLENYARCITTLFPHENMTTYHIPRGPTRRNPGGSLYSRFINQKISKKALAIGSGKVSPYS